MFNGNPLDYFDRTYVINLPERTDRKRETTKELQKFNATGGDLRWFKAVRGNESHGFPSLGAYGCFESHLRALTKAYDDGVENVLMIEDDIRITPNFLRAWPAVQDQLMAIDWDIAQLGFRSIDAVTGANRFALGRVTEPLRTTQCYAINGPVLGRFIGFLEVLKTRERDHPDGGRMHYDGAINVFCAQNRDVRRVGVSEDLATQRSSRSDIADNAWMDRNAFTRPIVGRLRVVKNRLGNR